MPNSRLRRNGWATVGLGLSIAFAVGAFVYFALAGSPLRGAALGVLVAAAGVWEYRRKIQDTVVAESYEAEAEAQTRKNRR
ncbi:hypothetical protein ELS19_09460 [Halogeometricum borinquense]|uniref:Uncharacterized protein n=1 Tax=Halogeometricum borinquense TaxID=60847 RepID=A0A482TBA8_9EURY|nr:hypothetical protein [Halogeometricum borinquense]RYJ14167.1 hypothetical protein ELS19_09460 [Halogeometricum borinquense]